MGTPVVETPLHVNNENLPPERLAPTNGDDLHHQRLQEHVDKRTRGSDRNPLAAKLNANGESQVPVPLLYASEAAHVNGLSTSPEQSLQEQAGRRPSLNSAKSGSIIQKMQKQDNGICGSNMDEGRSEIAGDSSGRVSKKSHSGEQTEKLSKLSSIKLYELASSPDSIPTRIRDIHEDLSPPMTAKLDLTSLPQVVDRIHSQSESRKAERKERSGSLAESADISHGKLKSPILSGIEGSEHRERPSLSSRTVSTPVLRPKNQSGKHSSIGPALTNQLKSAQPIPLALDTRDLKAESRSRKIEDPLPSPMPSAIPLPPMSISSFFQLELSSAKPSPLYIYRSSISDLPYESSRVKVERLLNFLLLPPQLESVLWFGALACLDAWLYTFTILPLRFLKAVSVLLRSWIANTFAQTLSVARFFYLGLGRVWRRRGLGQEQRSAGISPRENDDSHAKKTNASAKSATESSIISPNGKNILMDTIQEPARKVAGHRLRRPRSTPSTLLPVDKADILKGLLILISCFILMYFDASMMYHTIRGQAAIKLYVIYNVLEVFDRLLAALGQDVLECLFAKETLERKPDGRSKLLRPFWLFILALIYNIIHSTALFYQVITLNVAVNSYSNALLTLLMSNQFVEIKSTVFKKFEKENLFQMTCADVVERFQLWLMLIIIASRNLIETNNMFGGSGPVSGSDSSATIRSSSILPNSFTIFPDWTGQIMGPFVLVLGTEMLVDWVKHAYITKFNNTKPNIYGRFLDVLAKDYYTNAFADQDLNRRVGLPVIPLSCLFIRASVQTYTMFLESHLPLPLPSPSTSLLEPSDPSASPAHTAAMLRIDQLFRRALGRHVPASAPPGLPLFSLSWLPSADALIARVTTIVFFLLLFLLLLVLKLLLGMILLRYARGRYADMKRRESASENSSHHADGRRLGGWGVVEVDEDKRRWIYEDDPEGVRKLREKERDAKEREREREKEKAGGKGAGGFGHVERYSMVSKRIW